VGAGGGGRPLIDRLEVAWAPSATVYYRLRQGGRGAEGRDAGADATLLVLEDAPDSKHRLPYAWAEARWLVRSFTRAENFPSGRPVGMAELTRFTALHFASHSEVDDQHPWRSGIRVGGGPVGSGAGGGSASGGWLRASEIAPSRLDARLAVLASCRSAGGPVISGEGVIGLTGAFLSAGVPAVVATLWPVDDRATERLMRSFYVGLSQGLTASAALRRAQRSLQADARTSHPFYWAGFVLVGDPDVVVPLARRTGPDGTGILIGIAALAAFLAVVRSARARRETARAVTDGTPPSLNQ